MRAGGTEYGGRNVLAEQNAQLAGQVLFLQGQVEATRVRIALLEAPPQPAAARPRWRRLLGR
jgi:hypothetical protein